MIRFLLFAVDFGPLLLYSMYMKRPKKQRRPKAVEEAKRRADAMANATRGRSRTFKNRKKEANRNACRGSQPTE
jgi:hypothetical protein